MFSADELLNSGNSYVTYYGYDHTGKKVRGGTDIKIILQLLMPMVIIKEM
jgi:hypothetical protein